MNKEDEEMALWFLDKLCYGNSKEALEYWKDYCKSEKLQDIDNPKLVVAGPSRIVGLLKTKEMEKSDILKQDWVSYNVKRSFKLKKEILKNSDFFFDGYYFSSYLFITYCNEMFNDRSSLYIKFMKSNDTLLLVVKINEDYSFGIAQKIYNLSCPDTTVKEDGVIFIDYDEIIPDDEKSEIIYVEKDREFCKWVNGIATHTVKWKGRQWKTYLVDKSYFFEKEDEIGEMMLI